MAKSHTHDMKPNRLPKPTVYACNSCAFECTPASALARSAVPWKAHPRQGDIPEAQTLRRTGPLMADSTPTTIVREVVQKLLGRNRNSQSLAFNAEFVDELSAAGYEIVTHEDALAIKALREGPHVAVDFDSGTTFVVSGPNAGYWAEGGPTHEPSPADGMNRAVAQSQTFEEAAEKLLADTSVDRAVMQEVFNLIWNRARVADEGRRVPLVPTQAWVSHGNVHVIAEISAEAAQQFDGGRLKSFSIDTIVEPPQQLPDIPLPSGGVAHAFPVADHPYARDPEKPSTWFPGDDNIVGRNDPRFRGPGSL